MPLRAGVRLVEVAAEVAAELGLPGPAPAAVRACKDKAEFRDRLAAAGLGPVRHVLVTDPDDPAQQAAAAAVGFPLVCKPRALGGSVGVLRVDSVAELPAALRVAATADLDGTRSLYAGVLVEEFLAGPEISVDSAVSGGVAHPLVLADKTVGLAPYFEELGHVVPAADHPQLDAALAMVAQAHRVLGLDRLITHAEVKLTANGPRLVEINARLGGDLIPYLGLLATGVDLAGAAADLALGREPDLRPTRQAAAAVSLLYPDRDVRVRAVELADRPGGHPGLDRFEVVVAPGAEVQLPPRHFMSRVAFAVVTADTAVAAAARAAAVAAAVEVHGDPLDLVAAGPAPSEEATREAPCV